MGKYENMNGTDAPIELNFVTTRISRTEYRVSGTVVIKDDLKNYEVCQSDFIFFDEECFIKTKSFGKAPKNRFVKKVFQATILFFKSCFW